MKAISLLASLRNEIITGNMIAGALEKAQSRSTTYRYLEIARKHGFVVRTKYDGGYNWELNGRGFDFMEGYNELGI